MKKEEIEKLAKELSKQKSWKSELQKMTFEERKKTVEKLVKKEAMMEEERKLWQEKGNKKPGRKPGKEVMYLTNREFDQFWKTLKKHGTKRDYAMFWIAYRWGLRASEITKLRKAQDNLEDSLIYIYRVKGSISRQYGMPDDVKRALREWRKEREKMEKVDPLLKSNPYEFVTRQSGADSQMSVINVKKLFLRYAEMAGIPEDKRFVHTLRHTRGYRLANHEPPVDIKITKQVLGHKNIGNTDLYYELSERRQKELNHVNDII